MDHPFIFISSRTNIHAAVALGAEAPTEPCLCISYQDQELSAPLDEVNGAKWLAQLGYPYVEALKRIKVALGRMKDVNAIRHVKLAPLQVQFLMELRIAPYSIGISGMARFHDLATEKLIRERLIVTDEHELFKYKLTEKGQRYVEYLCNGTNN